jgi:hypothetical protein
MLTALILVCSLAATPDLGACTENNAVAVIRDAETFMSPVTCLMHGQAHLAATAIGRHLSADEAVKVICARSRFGAAPSPVTASSSTTAEATAAAR